MMIKVEEINNKKINYVSMPQVESMPPTDCKNIPKLTSMMCS